MKPSDIRTQLEYVLYDISDVSNALLINWCNLENRNLYRLVEGKDPGRLISTQSYSVSTSPSTQALPSDFKDIDTEGCGFYKVDADGDQTDERLIPTGFGSTSRGYYIVGTNVVFTGIDTESTYTLRYVPIPTDIALISTDLNIEDEYIELFTSGVKKRYHQWDEDPGAESIEDFRYARLRQDFIDTMRKDADVFSLPNNSGVY